METVRPSSENKGVEDAPHFAVEAGTDEVRAWEEIDTGRYMPRRTRGSYKGRALG